MLQAVAAGGEVVPAACRADIQLVDAWLRGATAAATPVTAGRWRCSWRLYVHMYAFINSTSQPAAQDRVQLAGMCPNIYLWNNQLLLVDQDNTCSQYQDSPSHFKKHELSFLYLPGRFVWCGTWCGGRGGGFGDDCRQQRFTHHTLIHVSLSAPLADHVPLQPMYVDLFMCGSRDTCLPLGLQQPIPNWV